MAEVAAVAAAAGCECFCSSVTRSLPLPIRWWRTIFQQRQFVGGVVDEQLDRLPDI